jgi:BlaI family penicillinase repressor
MARPPKTPIPSDAELDILRALWRKQPATAREIHEALNAGTREPRVVTTTAKLLQIMLGKRLVVRDETTWPHLYRACVGESSVLGRIATRTLDQVFNRSASQFMLHALEQGSVSARDVEEIKALLEAYQQEKQDD